MATHQIRGPPWVPGKVEGTQHEVETKLSALKGITPIPKSSKSCDKNKPQFLLYEKNNKTKANILIIKVHKYNVGRLHFLPLNSVPGVKQIFRLSPLIVARSRSMKAMLMMRAPEETGQ